MDIPVDHCGDGEDDKGGNDVAHMNAASTSARAKMSVATETNGETLAFQAVAGQANARIIA